MAKCAGPSTGMLGGKVAIVTGAGSGIGRATALRFAAEGASVVCGDLRNADVTAEEIVKAGGDAIGINVDITSEEANAELVAKAIDNWGTLDVFFANAGTAGRHSPALGTSASSFEQVLKVNVVGCFLGMKCAAMEMAKRGGGSIIATASVAGIRSGAGSTEYSASKAAVISLVKTMAWELGGKNIRLNAVCPGLVETGMTKPLFMMARQRGTEDKIGQLNPLGRPGEAAEIANTVTFLASDQASYINGQAIPVCGGLSASHPVTISRRRNM